MVKASLIVLVFKRAFDSSRIGFHCIVSALVAWSQFPGGGFRFQKLIHVETRKMERLFGNVAVRASRIDRHDDGNNRKEARERNREEGGEGRCTRVNVQPRKLRISRDKRNFWYTISCVPPSSSFLRVYPRVFHVPFPGFSAPYSRPL